MTNRSRLILLCAAGALFTGCRSYDPDTYDARLREATFEAYHDAIVDYYPDLDRVGLDPESLRTRWADEVIDAESATDYYHALGRMCAALDDPHIRMTPNYEMWSQEDGPLGATDLRVVEVDGRPRLWNMANDMFTELTRSQFDYNGWEVEVFDGAEPNNDIIDDVINIGPRHSRIEIELASPSGESRTVFPRKRGLRVRVLESDEIRIRRNGTSLYGDAGQSTREAVQARADAADLVRTYRGTYLDAWRIDDAAILLWNAAKTLPGYKKTEQLEEDLAEAAKVFEGTTCTLIDFRFQGGGKTPGFRAVMERLLDTDVKMTLRQESWFGFHDQTDRIRRSPAIVHGPTIVLANEFTASYGEWMTALLDRERDAMIVGAQTQGCEFCIVEIEAPDRSRLRFGGKPYTRTEGIPAFQSVGLTPDVEVSTAADQFDGGSLKAALLDTHDRQTLTALALLDELCEMASP
ncbi:MAG: S41 family peptidase [Phycisphaerales bacterium]|nr:S41 family peptidase [Phycisphaerales bacterium]